jgi:hypothetical protein
MGVTNSDLLLWATAFAAALSLSVTQSTISARVGSDHPIHVFLAECIRSRGYRLFVRIPRLLNTCYCAAVPLYVHWIVAHFRPAALSRAERLLNPVVNAVHVLLFAGLTLAAAAGADTWPGFAGLATCAFALTPQFYHAFSARNFGLSARGTGLLLLTLFFVIAYRVEAHPSELVGWVLLSAAGWLVWGFSTFAQQALCLISAILFLITGRLAPLAGVALGVIVFIALHPTYAIGYLRHTLQFIRTYRRDLAPIYILSRRDSLWRDLIRDIWLRLAKNPIDGLRYAYENSFLIVVLLNPLVPLACWATLSGDLPTHSFLAYSGAIALAGTITTILTSFRATRFLGEPERYVEAITPWGVLCGAYFLYAHAGSPGLVWALLLFLVTDLAQLRISTALTRHVGERNAQLDMVAGVVRQHVTGAVRFCSNDEQATKMLMVNDWEFAYCLAVGQDYCGMSLQQAFSKFPLLRREACQRIVATYKINACLLDRRVYDSLFDVEPADLRRITVVHETERYRLLVLEWVQDGTDAGSAEAALAT